MTSRRLLLLLFLACPAGVAHASTAPPSAASGAAAASQSAPAAGTLALDALAQDWLQTHADARAALERLPRRTEALVHLPSGRVAGGMPASLSEKDVYQIALIVDLTGVWSAEVDVQSCDARDPFRIFGSLKDVTPRTLDAPPPPQFALIAIQQPLRCGGGTMSYTMTVTENGKELPPQTASWRISPVHHAAATYGMGFDFGERPSYSVIDGKIAETLDQAGPTQRLGFTWFPLGVDYERMEWWNYVLNPFLLFSLDAPKDSFVVGTALTAKGGLSLAVGMSFDKANVLKGDAKPGDAVTGDVPVEKRWTSASRGWYLGFTLDQNALKAFKALMPGGK